MGSVQFQALAPRAELVHAENRHCFYDRSVSRGHAHRWVPHPGYVPDGCTCQLSRAALWQPEWVFGLLVYVSNGNGPTSSSCSTGRTSCTLRTGISFVFAPFLAGTLNAGCVPDGCTCRPSRAALWQPEWVFGLLVFWFNCNCPTSSSCPPVRTSCTVRTGSCSCDRSVSCASTSQRVSDGRTWRLSRAASWQPKWVFWLWELCLHHCHKWVCGMLVSGCTIYP
jgi:hypothetical protein